MNHQASIPSTQTLIHRPRTLALAVAAVLSAGVVAGCSSSTTPAGSESQAPTCPISVSDGWVKAADKGMTAAFGTLSNGGGQPVTITAAATPASTSMELHEVVDDNGTMVMKAVADGFPVPANGSLILEPGGYHLMLMDVTAPIKAGQDVTFTLTCSNGATTQVTAQAKDFTGGEESYKKDGMDSMAPSPAMS